MLSGRINGADFALDITGELGAPYRVQAAPVPLPSAWLDLLNFSNVRPTTTILDPAGASHPQRFYRVVSP